MKIEKTIGLLLIIGVITACIPYVLLSAAFDYPDVLRQETGIVLTKFYEGGKGLIGIWWLFAMAGLPLLEAYILLGQQLEKQFYFVRWATSLGVIGLLCQILGLLRWVFVVPILAEKFIHGSSEVQEISIIAFETIHQFAGVLLGEHIGQLFTIFWTIMMCSAFAKNKHFPNWFIYWGYLSSAIYLLAQMELFATVIPTIPVISWAGLVGSSLWLIWLLLLGCLMLKKSRIIDMV